MSIRWENLKAAESGWKLGAAARGQILHNCLQGKKARSFPWRYVGIPAAYLGVVTAVLFIGILLWPRTKPVGEDFILPSDSPSSSTPEVDEPSLKPNEPKPPVRVPAEDSVESLPSKTPDSQGEEDEEEGFTDYFELLDAMEEIFVVFQGEKTASYKPIKRGDKTYYPIGVSVDYVDSGSVDRSKEVLIWQEQNVGIEALTPYIFILEEKIDAQTGDCYYTYAHGAHGYTRVADYRVLAQKVKKGKATKLERFRASVIEQCAWISGRTSTEKIRQFSSMVKEVKWNQSDELERLTAGALGDHFDYEIYYYGIEAFYIEVDGKTVELRDALAKDPKVIDLLYAEWARDSAVRRGAGEDLVYLDGGSKVYDYEDYYVLDCQSIIHTVSPDDMTVNHSWDEYWEDLVIGRTNMHIDDVEKRLLIDRDSSLGFSHDEPAYIYEFEPDPHPLIFVLHQKEGRFSFKFCSFNNFTARGVYKISGNKLILQTTGEFDYKYVFEKVEGGYRFMAAESSKIPSYRYGKDTEPICPLKDGVLFTPYKKE